MCTIITLLTKTWSIHYNGAWLNLEVYHTTDGTLPKGAPSWNCSKVNDPQRWGILLLVRRNREHVPTALKSAVPGPSFVPINAQSASHQHPDLRLVFSHPFFLCSVNPLSSTSCPHLVAFADNFFQPTFRASLLQDSHFLTRLFYATLLPYSCVHVKELRSYPIWSASILISLRNLSRAIPDLQMPWQPNDLQSGITISDKKVLWAPLSLTHRRKVSGIPPPPSVDFCQLYLILILHL